MPTVPVYDTPQVAPGAQPLRQYDAPAMPDVAGKQMQQLGQASLTAGTTAIKIADKIEADKDDAATKELDNALADRFRVLMYDKDAGYLTKVGKDAVTSREDVLKSLQEERKRVESGATSDIQKLMFKQVADKRMQSVLQQVDVHAAGQTKVWKEGETVARVKSSIADAVANSVTWNQPGSPFATAKATAVAEANDLASLRGYDTIQREQLVSETLASMHGTVLQNMVSLGQTKTAKDYLEATAPEIAKGAPDKLDNLRNLVKQAGVKDEGLTLSMTLTGGLQDQTKALSQMFSDGKISAEVYDNARQRVEHNWQMRKAQQDEGNKAAMGQAQDWVLKNPGKSIMDMPPNLYAWAKGQGHLAGLDAFAQREGRPAERQKELTVRGEMLTTAMGDPDSFIAEFKKTGFSDRMDLGLNGIKEMQNIAGEMIRGDGKYKMAFNQKTLEDAIPADLLRQANKDKKDAFVAVMAEESERWRKANPGKSPDAAAYQQVITAANQEWVSIGKMWNSSEKAYEARAKQDPRAVPKDFYQNMKTLGASEDEIIKAWAIKKGGK